MTQFIASRIPVNTRIPDWLGSDGTIRLMSVREIDQASINERRLWCHTHGRYGLVSVELIAFLRSYIGGRRAIEIGAGAGDLCHHLQIHGTDSKMQDKPSVAATYKLLGSPTITYPSWVETLEAEQAIERYQPEVVLVSWVTHYGVAPNDTQIGSGSVFGIKEDRILQRGVEYIFIGNCAVHQFKPILQLPHIERSLSFLRSRALYPELDRLMIWNPDLTVDGIGL